MDYNSIIPAVLGVLSVLITQWLSARMKAKAEAEKAEAEAEKIKAEARQISVEVTGALRDQLLEEIDRLKNIVETQRDELNGLRIKTRQQQQTINALRLELSETEARYKRQVEELKRTLDDCQQKSREERKQWQLILQENRATIEGLKMQLKAQRRNA